MPSVYLEQGGRLRCQASRGYWQVYDGMPSSAGVIGLTFRTGTATECRDITEHPEFVESVPSIVAELCVPLKIGERTVGVINADSPTRPDDGVRWEVERCADLLSRRIEQLGGPETCIRPRSASPARWRACPCSRTPRTSSARPSARRSSSPASSPRWSRSPTGTAASTCITPKARSRSCSPTSRCPSSTRSPTGSASARSYTVAETSGRGFAGHQTLRGAGAASLAVLPLTVAGQRLGILVLADRLPHRLGTDHVELLELLAVQAAGGLRMAAAVLELRERAARDPLTGLGHHATFHDSLPSVRRSTPRTGTPQC